MPEQELEARIRVRRHDDETCLFDVAIGHVGKFEHKLQEAQEAYQILYYKKRNLGKIIEASYKRGIVIPNSKIDVNSVPLVEVKESIINTALTPIVEKGGIALEPYHFKPLSKEDLMYIKNNCYRG